MEKEEREVRERKGRRGIEARRGRERGNGSGPDQVREKIDARVHIRLYYFEYKNNRPIASRLQRVKLPTSFNIDKLLRPK